MSADTHPDEEMRRCPLCERRGIDVEPRAVGPVTLTACAACADDAGTRIRESHGEFVVRHERPSGNVVSVAQDHDGEQFALAVECEGVSLTLAVAREVSPAAVASVLADAEAQLAVDGGGR